MVTPRSLLQTSSWIRCGGQLSVDFEPVQKPIDRTIVKIVTLPYDLDDQFQEPTTVMVLKLVVLKTKMIGRALELM